MKQIVPGIYTVEGLLIGRVYVIESADGLTVIDASLPNSVRKIESEIASLGRKLTDIKRLLVTHAHPDHIGSLPALQRASGAHVYVHQRDASITRGERPFDRPAPEALTGLARLTRMSVSDQKMEGSRVDRELHEGDVLDEVLPGLTVIETPGHSLGQVCYWYPAKRLMFCGDTIVRLAGLRLPVAAFTVDMTEAKRSIRKIAALDIDILCFGHGAPLIGGAAATIRPWVAAIQG
jgi:glyoxylase-like metal-dependent hydrolase (beta-lactamase superfamily II)